MHACMNKIESVCHDLLIAPRDDNKDGYLVTYVKSSTEHLDRILSRMTDRFWVYSGKTIIVLSVNNRVEAARLSTLEQTISAFSLVIGRWIADSLNGKNLDYILAYIIDKKSILFVSAIITVSTIPPIILSVFSPQSMDQNLTLKFGLPVYALNNILNNYIKNIVSAQENRVLAVFGGTRGVGLIGIGVGFYFFRYLTKLPIKNSYIFAFKNCNFLLINSGLIIYWLRYLYKNRDKLGTNIPKVIFKFREVKLFIENLLLFEIPTILWVFLNLKSENLNEAEKSNTNLLIIINNAMLQVFVAGIFERVKGIIKKVNKKEINTDFFVLFLNVTLFCVIPITITNLILGFTLESPEDSNSKSTSLMFALISSFLTLRQVLFSIMQNSNLIYTIITETVSLGVASTIFLPRNPSRNDNLINLLACLGYAVVNNSLYSLFILTRYCLKKLCRPVKNNSPSINTSPSEYNTFESNLTNETQGSSIFGKMYTFFDKNRTTCPFGCLKKICDYFSPSQPRLN